ncbi:MAG: hypothetical protein ACR2L0_02540 [Gaiellaceae bacterium]
MVPEANIVKRENGLVPDGEGWYVLNARESTWLHTDDFGVACTFEGDVRFAEFGINVSVLEPGQPACMYHGEEAQEELSRPRRRVPRPDRRRGAPAPEVGFRPLSSWTEHVLVGAGSGPCVILAVGTRGSELGVLYPVSDLARKHGAGVEAETPVAEEAYAAYGETRLGPYRDSFLPA